MSGEEYELQDDGEGGVAMFNENGEEVEEQFFDQNGGLGIGGDGGGGQQEEEGGGHANGDGGGGAEEEEARGIDVVTKMTAIANRIKKQKKADQKLKQFDSQTLKERKKTLEGLICAWMNQRSSVCTKILLNRDHKIVFVHQSPSWTISKIDFETFTSRVKSLLGLASETLLRNCYQHHMDILMLAKIENVNHSISISHFLARVIFDALVESVSKLTIKTEVKDTNPNDDVVIVQVHQHNRLPRNMQQALTDIRNGVANGGGAAADRVALNRHNIDNDNGPTDEAVRLAEKKRKYRELLENASPEFEAKRASIVRASKVKKQDDAHADPLNGVHQNQFGAAAAANGGAQQSEARSYGQLHARSAALINVNARNNQTPIDRLMMENRVSNFPATSSDIANIEDYYMCVTSKKINPKKVPDIIQRIRASNYSDNSLGKTEVVPLVLLSHFQICDTARKSTKKTSFDILHNQKRIEMRKYYNFDLNAVGSLPVREIDEGTFVGTHPRMVGHVFIDDLAVLQAQNLGAGDNPIVDPVIDVLQKMTTSFVDARDELENQKAAMKQERDEVEGDPMNFLQDVQDGIGNYDDSENPFSGILSPDVNNDIDTTALERLTAAYPDHPAIDEGKARMIKHVMEDPNVKTSVDGRKKIITTKLSTMSVPTPTEVKMEITVAAPAFKSKAKIAWVALSTGLKNFLDILLPSVERETILSIDNTLAPFLNNANIDPTINVSGHPASLRMCIAILQFLFEMESTLVGSITERMMLAVMEEHNIQSSSVIGNLKIIDPALVPVKKTYIAPIGADEEEYDDMEIRD